MNGGGSRGGHTDSIGGGLFDDISKMQSWDGMPLVMSSRAHSFGCRLKPRDGIDYLVELHT